MPLPNVKRNTGIGLVAPAGAVKPEQIREGIQILKENGFPVKQGKHLYESYRHFAGTIEQRVEDIHTFLHDPEIDVLLAIRGGSGSAQLLPEIDFQLWKRTGKLLIGFSDITAMQWGLWAKTELASLSGMALTLQLHKQNPYTQLFVDILSGKKSSIQDSDLALEEIVVHRAGSVEDVLLGGTLSIINSLLGTPFFPRLSTFILFIEDINEPIYKIERSLAQLKMAGVLDKVSGLILGRFIDEDKALEIWQTLEYLFPRDVPVVANFPYGHYPDSCVLPLGLPVRLESTPFRLSW